MNNEKEMRMRDMKIQATKGGCMTLSDKILVTGAGGFIGHHLVARLKNLGYWVRGVDQKYPQFAASDADEFLLLDLRREENCLAATSGMDEVYALAADMGGMGFISNHHAEILYNNALINFHTLEAARRNRVKRYLYTSSACIYPEYRQEDADVIPLKEEEAYPAQPQDAYGWEKLISERLCLHYREDYQIETRVVRFHNIFGPLGSWDGGREKAPAAPSSPAIRWSKSGATASRPALFVTSTIASRDSSSSCARIFITRSISARTAW
jgi:GDP-D-mannose 3',5'-epimerase